ncbi:MAG TPA: hypothetical protein VGK63_07755, partial [Candidatus Limnocylindrales bacterium]
MPQLPSVRDVARGAARAGSPARAVRVARDVRARAVERAGRVGPAGRVGAPPRAGLFERLADRIASREVLRLRGRFRGRRGVLAFLAVMGPGLIAGIAGNDAGGIAT